VAAPQGALGFGRAGCRRSFRDPGVSDVTAWPATTTRAGRAGAVVAGRSRGDARLVVGAPRAHSAQSRPIGRESGRLGRGDERRSGRRAISFDRGGTAPEARRGRRRAHAQAPTSSRGAQQAGASRQAATANERYFSRIGGGVRGGRVAIIVAGAHL
jgi:hypothetical protein